MKRITVTLNIDEAALKAESSLDNLEEAINRELGWLHDSGMFVEAWSFTDQTPVTVPPQVFVLCEEYEGDDGIREFSIHGISEDKNFLREKMEALIKEDFYGFIKNKGVDDHSEDHFSTNFDCGFVEYYILEQEVLSRDERNRTVGEKASLDEQIAKAAPVLTNTEGNLHNRKQGREH